jgi:hypothetical protein
MLFRILEGVEGEANPAISWEAGLLFWLLSIFLEGSVKEGEHIGPLELTIK